MIQVEGLHKRFGRRVVLDSVTFACPPGSVTGFLGPNGAGKSTTLRILVGMTRADRGSATVMGEPYKRLLEPAKTVGTMLDAAALHGGRTARETLALHARAIGSDPTDAIALLGDVGLGGTERRRVGSFSLGMRQRLGIAVALVGRPRVLILDEPYNGLDPEGVQWVRRLLRDFVEDGGAALLSSHLLNEVRETVDRLVVLNAGNVVAEGSLDELLVRKSVVTRTTEPQRLAAVLDENSVPAQQTGPETFVVRADARRLSQILYDGRFQVLELTPRLKSVEDLYFAHTGASS